jgi:site-specific DNA recombinase
LLGVKGAISEQFLIDLRQKVRRGHLGRLRAGRIPGGRCYGYDVVLGEDRGRRVVKETQAAIIRRIFREYADGRGPIAIVADLNREGVPGPRGGNWNASTLVGSKRRVTGILQNPCYIGQFIFDRQRYVKDPATGKRQARPNAEADWSTQDFPDLRIIDDALWQDVQARRAASATKHPAHQRRPRRVLSGLLRCGLCGGPAIVQQRSYVGCSNYSNKRTCDNRCLISMAEIERRVLEALRTHLLSPERIELAVEAYRKEREERARRHAKDRRALEGELADTKAALERVLDMVCKGIGEQADLGQRMKDLAARRRELEAKLPLADQGSVAVLHPAAARSYRAKVEEIQAALTKGDAAGHEAVKLVRGMIDHIDITPGPDRMALTMYGDLSILLGNKPSPEGELERQSWLRGCATAYTV